MISGFLTVLIAVAVVALVIIALLYWRAGEAGWQALEDNHSPAPADPVGSSANSQGRRWAVVGKIWKLIFGLASLVPLAVVVWLLFSMGTFVVTSMSSCTAWIGQQRELANQLAATKEAKSDQSDDAKASQLTKEEQGAVLDFMNAHLPTVTTESEWQLLRTKFRYRRTWLAGENGYDPLPVNVALISGKMSLINPNEIKYSFEADVYDQHHLSQPGYDARLLSIAGGQKEIVPGMSALFVKLTRHQLSWQGPIDLAFTLEVEPAEQTGLRIGRYREFMPKPDSESDRSTFGLLPFNVDGVDDKKVDWTVQINFIPLTNRSDSGIIDDPAVQADYYLTRYHEVTLRANSASDQQVVYGPKRVRQDSYQLSSAEIRESWADGKAIDSAWLNIKVFDPFLVHVIVLFEKFVK
jgi:hypothetical protein